MPARGSAMFLVQFDTQAIDLPRIGVTIGNMGLDRADRMT